MSKEKVENKEAVVINEQPKKKMSKWLVVLIVVGCLYYLVPIGLFAAAIITDGFSIEYKVMDDGSINIDRNKLTIQKDVKGYYDEEKAAYYIEGKIVNNTKKDYNGIGINYLLYNEEGEVLGEASNYIQKLGAGKTWNFKVIYDDVDASKVVKFEYYSSY